MFPNWNLLVIMFVDYVQSSCDQRQRCITCSSSKWQKDNAWRSDWLQIVPDFRNRRLATAQRCTVLRTCFELSEFTNTTNHAMHSKYHRSGMISHFSVTWFLDWFLIVNGQVISELRANIKPEIGYKPKSYRTTDARNQIYAISKLRHANC